MTTWPTVGERFDRLLAEPKVAEPLGRALDELAARLDPPRTVSYCTGQHCAKVCDAESCRCRRCACATCLRRAARRPKARRRTTESSPSAFDAPRLFGSAPARHRSKGATR